MMSKGKIKISVVLEWRERKTEKKKNRVRKQNRIGLMEGCNNSRMFAIFQGVDGSWDAGKDGNAQSKR